MTLHPPIQAVMHGVIINKPNNFQTVAIIRRQTQGVFHVNGQGRWHLVVEVCNAIFPYQAQLTAGSENPGKYHIDRE
jgi:hypothetical protein